MAIKKFTRSSTHKMLAGVCGGISGYFAWDVTWVRLATIGITLVTMGFGAAVYLLAWLLLPDDRDGGIGLDSVADFYAAHRNRPTPPDVSA
jgi:phage shock protein PspC (stress-responsive transcriptional regulator)